MFSRRTFYLCCSGFIWFHPVSVVVDLADLIQIFLMNPGFPKISRRERCWVCWVCWVQDLREVLANPKLLGASLGRGARAAEGHSDWGQNWAMNGTWNVRNGCLMLPLKKWPTFMDFAWFCIEFTMFFPDSLVLPMSETLTIHGAGWSDSVAARWRATVRLGSTSAERTEPSFEFRELQWTTNIF